MFGGLRKRLEEITAQVNPFDGGKTASTVRAARKQPVAPVQTVRQPTNKPPSYGGGIGGFVNRTRDVFDANTPQDNWKREQAAKQWKAPLQAPKPVDARGILSRVYDQANIFDNNRTFEQSTPTNQKSAFQQGGQFTGQLGRGVVGGTTRVANTIGAQGAQAIATGQMLMAQATGNEEAFRNANATAQAADENFKRGEGGILNTGTLYNADEARKGEFTTGAKRIGGGIAESGLEVGSMGLGGFTGKQVVNQGLKQGLKSQVPVIAKNVLLNTAQGGVMAANQGASAGDIAKSAALGGTLGTVADVGLGLGGAAISKAARNIPTTNLAPSIKAKATQLAANEGGFIELGRTPKNIHPEDQNIMADFIDMQRGVYKPTQQGAYNLEIDASRIAERYGLPMPNNPKALADVFDQRLQQDGFGKLGKPDMDVEQRLALDYMKNPNRPAPSTSLVGEGAQAPLQMPPSRKQQLMDNMRKLASDEQGGIPFRPDEPQTPKGFILKETKGRGGRKDTVRVSKGADGKLEKTYQTEFDTKSADPYIKEYADSLRQMESGLRGGDMIPDGEGGYKRISEHSKFYREHFANTGKKPTRADWYAEAERQVKSGKADKDFMEYYNAKVTDRGTAPDNAKVLENKPTRRMTEQEWDSLVKQAEVEAPKSKSAVNSATEGMKKEQLSAVSQGDFKRAQEIRTKIGDIEQGLKRTPPDLSKRAEDIVSDIELKDIKGKSNKPVKEQFMKRANDYLGERRAAQFRAVDEARKFNEQFGNLTEKQKIEVIRATDDASYKTSDPEVQKAVDDLHTRYDEAYRYFTEDKGVKMGYQHSYYPRMYKNPATGELIDGAQFNLLQRASARQKGRTADLVAEDFLITKDPAEALQRYHSSLEEAAAGKKFLNDLQKEGLVVSSTDPVRGMRPVVAEGMQEGGTIFYAKPEVAKSLDKMFGTQEASGAFEKLVEKGQGLNSFMQSVVLSGGIPNTPVNAFGIMQVMKETMAGHPIIAGKAFFKSMGRKNTDQFFKARSDTLQEMVKNGYDLRVDYNAKYRNMFGRIKEAGQKNGKMDGLNEAWDQFTNDATFQRFLPMMETMHYEQVKKGLVRRGMSPEVAAKRATDATANYFGKTSLATTASRNKVGQDALGAVAFAPRFRESMVNFWIKNAQALNPKNIGKVEYRSNQMFMVTAAATWAAMEGANKAMNGNWMHDNPDGKKDKLIIPDKFVPFNTNGKDVGVPFLSSVATVPRNAAMGAYNLATGNFKEAGKNVASFASMPLKTAGEVLTNENYFGQRIVDEDATGAQKLGQMAAYVGRSNTQPWLREGINVAGQSLPDDIKKLMGVKKKSTSETISNALEAPVRFYDPQYYKGGKGDMMAGSKFKGSGVKIGDKTEKNAAGKYTSRSKYDAVIDAYYKKDGSIKVNNYDNAELSKTIRDVAGEANKTLADMGLPEVKADSRTAQIWAKYQKRLQDGKISEIKKDYVQRGVIKDIYKTQLSKDVNDFYTISSDTAMRSAIEKGLVKKETLDKAIQFDDMMVASGLSPYSQIGKKLRSELGYSSPSSSKSTGGRRSSGRKSAGRKGSRGGKKAAKFDYTKNLFDTGRGGSKATTASLRKILEQAMSDFKTKA